MQLLIGAIIGLILVAGVMALGNHWAHGLYDWFKASYMPRPTQAEAKEHIDQFVGLMKDFVKSTEQLAIEKARMQLEASKEKLAAKRVRTPKQKDSKQS